MLLGETFAVALSSIRANTLRSLLTMLGIIIGVGAVITMVALGTGAQKAVRGPDRGAGRERLHRLRGPGALRRRVMITDRTVLSTDDYEALRRDATLLKAVVPEAQQSLQVVFGNQNRNLQRHRHDRELRRRARTTPCRSAGCSPPATTRPGSATRCWAPRCRRCSAATRPP